MSPEVTLVLGPLLCGTCGRRVRWIRTVLGELLLVEDQTRPDILPPGQPHECGEDEE